MDVVLVEDEYPDGRLAWFENRPTHSAENSWIEHPIDSPLNFSHSLRTGQDTRAKQVHVLAGEMNEGGWAAPYNWDARLIEYTSVNGGKSWRSEIIYQGEGTHEAVRADLDNSGTRVIFGHAAQIIAKPGPYTGWVQMFRARAKPSLLDQYQHAFVDRDKPYTSIDIHAVDVDGDGSADIVCGAWWYKNPTWERHLVPGVAQIINAYDLDKDGKMELIGIKARAGGKGFYGALCSDLVWLKSIDLSKDLWEEHPIGSGDGDWPHGNTMAPLLPGDRVQFTAPYRDEHIANRQLGTVQQIDAGGNLQVRLESGQEVQFNIREHPHVDYGYAVTSHSSQGATADRVLVHVDTEQAHDQLVNSRLAYVSVSRGRYDAQIYTNDAQKLSEELSRDVSKQSALETGQKMCGRDQGHVASSPEHQSVSESHEHSGGYGVGH